MTTRRRAPPRAAEQQRSAKPAKAPPRRSTTPASIGPARTAVAPHVGPARTAVAPHIGPARTAVAPHVGPARIAVAPHVGPARTTTAPHVGPARTTTAPHVGPLPDALIEDLVDAGSREHYADAAIYDHEYRRRRADVTFYRELAREVANERRELANERRAREVPNERREVANERRAREVPNEQREVANERRAREVPNERREVANERRAREVPNERREVANERRAREVADERPAREVDAERGGIRILELGAGSGRVTIPLARDGHRVVAVDRAPAMLAKLRERVAALPDAVRERIAVRDGDLCTFDVRDAGADSRARDNRDAGGDRRAVDAGAGRGPGDERGFDLAIAAFNVFEHLYTRGEFAACLARVAAHLAPGGKLAFDVQMPDLAWLIRDPRKRWAKTRFTDPTTKRAWYYSTNHDYDAVAQIANIRLFYDPVDHAGPARVVKLSQRKFFPAELEALVAHAGFQVVDRFGDFARRPLDDRAESQVLIAIPRRK